MYKQILSFLCLLIIGSEPHSKQGISFICTQSNNKFQFRCCNKKCSLHQLSLHSFGLLNTFYCCRTYHPSIVISCVSSVECSHQIVKLFFFSRLLLFERRLEMRRKIRIEMIFSLKSLPSQKLCTCKKCLRYN